MIDRDRFRRRPARVRGLNESAGRTGRRFRDEDCETRLRRRRDVDEDLGSAAAVGGGAVIGGLLGGPIGAAAGAMVGDALTEDELVRRRPTRRVHDGDPLDEDLVDGAAAGAGALVGGLVGGPVGAAGGAFIGDMLAGEDCESPVDGVIGDVLEDEAFCLTPVDGDVQDIVDAAAGELQAARSNATGVEPDDIDDAVMNGVEQPAVDEDADNAYVANLFKQAVSRIDSITAGVEALKGRGNEMLYGNHSLVQMAIDAVQRLELLDNAVAEALKQSAPPVDPMVQGIVDGIEAPAAVADVPTVAAICAPDETIEFPDWL